MTHRIAILGASGYTGAELVRLIATHPGMRIVALSAVSAIAMNARLIIWHKPGRYTGGI